MKQAKKKTFEFRDVLGKKKAVLENQTRLPSRFLAGIQILLILTNQLAQRTISNNRPLASLLRRMSPPRLPKITIRRILYQIKKLLNL